MNARFRVEIDGLQETGATEVIFPEARIVSAGRKARVVQYGHLTLRRGLTGSSEWFQWWEHARKPAGAAARKQVSIVLMDARGTDVTRWTFADAMPAAYSVSPLNALGNQPLIETLEVSVRGLKVEFSRSPA